MSNRVQNKICIALILIFISTLLSKPIAIKADSDYDYHGSGCEDQNHSYCVFINNIVIPSGFEYRIRKESIFYKANMDIYDKDKDAHKAFKIVYGDYNDISNNEKDAKGEWRYLGFDMKGTIVSNEDFTNDREIGEDEKFTEWIFKDNVTGAQGSWNNARLYFRPEIIEYNKKVEWLKEGKKTGLSVNFKNLNDENKDLISELRVHVTEYTIDSSTIYTKIQESDKGKYGGTRTEEIEVEKNDEFITFKREDFTETTPNEHLVTFKGIAYFRSDLTGEEREVELTKTIKITIEDRDESAKRINVKHFEKDAEDGSTSLLGESNTRSNNAGRWNCFRCWLSSTNNASTSTYRIRP